MDVYSYSLSIVSEVEVSARIVYWRTIQFLNILLRNEEQELVRLGFVRGKVVTTNR